jgi:hypothetical protein
MKPVSREKIRVPDSGITKADPAQHRADVADRMLTRPRPTRLSAPSLGTGATWALC